MEKFGAPHASVGSGKTIYLYKTYGDTAYLVWITKLYTDKDEPYRIIEQVAKVMPDGELIKISHIPR